MHGRFIVISWPLTLTADRQCLRYSRRKMFSLRRHNKFFLTYLNICTSNHKIDIVKREVDMKSNKTSVMGHIVKDI